MFKKVKDKPYYTNNHSCFFLTAHLVLVTKYRKPVLQGKVRDYVYTLTKETMEAKKHHHQRNEWGSRSYPYSV